MEIPRPTFRGILALVLGCAIGLVGLNMLRESWTRIGGVSLCLLGFGLASLGLTNGFTDYSPLGKLLYKLGLIAFGLGVPLALYEFLYNGAF